MIRCLLCLIIVIQLLGCRSKVLLINDNTAEAFSDVISQIDTESYNEIDWITGEPTKGIIIYNGYKLCDIDDDGIDELFVLRQYINTQEKYKSRKSEVSDLNDFYKYAIRQSFISESYKIVDGKAEQMYLDGEPLMTQAFEGGHFGTYYFLLDNGNIAKFYNSYWEENLVIYENMKCKITLSHKVEPGIDEWWWEMDGEKVDKDRVARIIKSIRLFIN